LPGRGAAGEEVDGQRQSGAERQQQQGAQRPGLVVDRFSLVHFIPLPQRPF
jgi:hypothetical protein